MNRWAVSSWSTGKDSCLACFKAMQAGHQIKYLVNFVSKEHKRCCFHGIEARLLKTQTELTGIPLVQREASSGMEEYENEFKQALSELKAEGVGRMVFGDVYLDEHKEWVERVCGERQVQPIEPLWGVPAKKVVEEFIDLGFKAIVVSAQAKVLGKDAIGRYLDRDFLNELKSRKICPCGENGEFHTFVVDGPIFKKRIEITKAEPVLKEGFWKYWFLDIQEYKVV